jgi:hypothetical protein
MTTFFKPEKLGTKIGEHHSKLGKLDVHHSNGMYFAYHGDHNVGTASISDDHHHIVSVTVQPHAQRHGVATALYNTIEKHIGKKLNPSPTYQTDAGKAFSRTRESMDESPLYRMKYRPPGFASLPKGLNWDYHEVPSTMPHVAAKRGIPLSKHLHGVIKTDRHLTPDEMDSYEIEPHNESYNESDDREAHELTHDEWVKRTDDIPSKYTREDHRSAVADALKNGKHVPSHVKAEYPGIEHPMNRLSDKHKEHMDRHSMGYFGKPKNATPSTEMGHHIAGDPQAHYDYAMHHHKTSDAKHAFNPHPDAKDVKTARHNYKKIADHAVKIGVAIGEPVKQHESFSEAKDWVQKEADRRAKLKPKLKVVKPTCKCCGAKPHTGSCDQQTRAKFNTDQTKRREMWKSNPFSEALDPSERKHATLKRKGWERSGESNDGMHYTNSHLPGHMITSHHGAGWTHHVVNPITKKPEQHGSGNWPGGHSFSAYLNNVQDHAHTSKAPEWRPMGARTMDCPHCAKGVAHTDAEHKRFLLKPKNWESSNKDFAMARFNDLQRQGFMRSAYASRDAKPKVPKPAPKYTSCVGCMDWHPEGKHNKDAATRKANIKKDAADSAAYRAKLGTPKSEGAYATPQGAAVFQPSGASKKKPVARKPAEKGKPAKQSESNERFLHHGHQRMHDLLSSLGYTRQQHSETRNNKDWYEAPASMTRSNYEHAQWGDKATVMSHVARKNVTVIVQSRANLSKRYTGTPESIFARMGG